MNPTRPSRTSPSVISGWEGCLSALLTSWLAVVAQTCMEITSPQNEMGLWRKSTGMQKSVHFDFFPSQAETWWKTDFCLWGEWKGVWEISRWSCFSVWLPSDVTCPNCFTHIHLLSATCASCHCEGLIQCCYAGTCIPVQWCTTFMHVRNTWDVCKAPFDSFICITMVYKSHHQPCKHD